MILHKSTTLNREEQTEVNSFNKLLSAYHELYDPNVKLERSSLKDKFEDLSDIFSQGPLIIEK